MALWTEADIHFLLSAVLSGAVLLGDCAPFGVAFVGAAVRLRRPGLAGTNASTTGRLLDSLALCEIPATSFLVGSRLADNPEGQAIVWHMAAEGHQIDLHAFEYVKITDLSRRDYDTQVGRARVLLTQIAGPGDWKDRDVHRIVSAVTEHVKDGDIMTSTTAR